MRLAGAFTVIVAVPPLFGSGNVDGTVRSFEGSLTRYGPVPGAVAAVATTDVACVQFGIKTGCGVGVGVPGPVTAVGTGLGGAEWFPVKQRVSITDTLLLPKFAT